MPYRFYITLFAFAAVVFVLWSIWDLYLGHRIWFGIKLLIASVALILLCSTIAHAADWLPVARQCVAEIEQKYGCMTSCANQLFPEYARCTNARLKPPYPPDKFEGCIRDIKRSRAAVHAYELRGDPVVDVFACVSR